ncbi:MAG: diguanylate cyclase, partial [Proteobacteria bacterium]|nr:diguanylate cyclase [Pseudomonadota bacterium]
MKLLPKLSFFTFLLVLSTASMAIFVSINTIKSIIDDLNIQLAEKDLNAAHQVIHDKYSALEKHDLQHIKSYYQKALVETQKKLITISMENKGHLAILSQSGKEILHSPINFTETDKDFIHPKYLTSIQQSIKTTSLKRNHNPVIQRYELSESNMIVFYKNIPEWDWSLFLILEREILYSRLNNFVNEITIKLLTVLVIALLAGFLISRYLVTRIKLALWQIRNVQDDKLQDRIEHIQGQDEISELHTGLNQMTQIIADKVKKQALSEEKIIASQVSLQKQHALLCGFINAMPELAFILDETGKYIEIFGSHQELLYKQKELLLGKKLSNILPESTTTTILDVIKTTLRTKQSQIIEYELEINGKNTYFEGHTAVLDFENKTASQTAKVIWIAHDITELVLARQKADRLSLYDTLTELPNRRLLMQRLDEEIARAKRHHQLGAILFIDLDDFKQINDNFGHATGDLVLVEVAHRLSNQLRKEDIACRLGGDEFVLLLSNLKDDVELASTQAKIIAEKTLEIIQKIYIIEDNQHKISCSIGVVLFA